MQTEKNNVTTRVHIKYTATKNYAPQSIKRSFFYVFVRFFRIWHDDVDDECNYITEIGDFTFVQKICTELFFHDYYFIVLHITIQ